MKVITYTRPENIEGSKLPDSYLQFISEFGYGTYCDLLNISAPDDQVIYSTFSDFDFWEFTEKFRENDLAHAVQISSNVDGDIICSLPQRTEKLFILPRNSEEILRFNDFNEILKYYSKTSTREGLYFMPWYQREIELCSLINQGKLLEINPIHENFLSAFKWDYTLGNQQPKYVFERLGGWVQFDLLYRNSITISYQQVPESDHLLYIHFIKNEIQKLIG